MSGYGGYYYSNYNDPEYYSSSEYSEEDTDKSESNDLFKCDHCSNYMPQRALAGHIERKHPEEEKIKCEYCSNYMPQRALEGHIERKHPEYQKVTCVYCHNHIPKKSLEAHIEQKHKTVEMVGLIHPEKIKDQLFNTLVAGNKIFSKNGVIYAVSFN